MKNVTWAGSVLPCGPRKLCLLPSLFSEDDGHSTRVYSTGLHGEGAHSISSTHTIKMGHVYEDILNNS